MSKGVGKALKTVYRFGQKVTRRVRKGQPDGFDAASKVGDVGQQAVILGERLAETGDRALARRLRFVQGQLRELSPEWLPMPGAVPTVDVTQIDCDVAHLFKTTTHFEFTGGSVRGQSIVRALTGIGLSNDVYTPLGYPSTQGITGYPLEVRDDSARYVRLPALPREELKAFPYDRALVYEVRALAIAMSRRRPSLIHAHSGYRGYENALKALALRQILRVPVVYEYRSIHEHTWTADAELATRSDLFRRRVAQENRCLNEADAVVTLSTTLKEHLVERGVPAEKISIVPNAIEPAEFGGDRGLPVYERPARPEGAKLVLGYLGNFHDREGLDSAIHALAAVRKNGVDAELRLIGQSEARKDLRQLAAKLGVTANVTFTGPVDHLDVGSHFGKFDIFLLPRKDELASRFVTPLKPLEAMFFGVPLVASDLPALREVLGPPERGMCVRPSNPAALAATIQTLAEDPSMRFEIARKAREWVLAERTWKQNAQRYEQVYERARAAFEASGVAARRTSLGA